MFKVLLKKQMQEVFKSCFYNSKNNTARSAESTVLRFAGFMVVMVCLIGGMFIALAHSLCAPFHEAGMDWMYFLLMAFLSVLLAVFGSVFNTYSSLYLSKDNDLLFSLPLSVRDILLSRLGSTYLLGTIYAAVAFIPAILVYAFTCFNFVTILSSSIFFIGLSVFVLSVSCILGYGVARISVKMKNRSYISVLASLVFLGLYYFFYFKAQSLLTVLLNNILTYGEAVQDKAFVLYVIGQAAAGNLLYLLCITLINMALFALVWHILESSFLKIASSSQETGRLKTKHLQLKQNSAFRALVNKEITRFTSSATYMLNAGMGILLMIVCTVSILLKRDFLYYMFPFVAPSLTDAFILGVFFFLIPSNFMGGCTISLEGKHLWVTKSLPVSTKDILLSKVTFHALFTCIPAVLCSTIVTMVMGVSALNILSILACSIFFSFLDVILNLCMPTLSWTNEMTVIKQSGCSMVAMLGGWLYPAVFALVYWLMADTVLSPSVLVLLWTLLTSIATYFLYHWLITEGVKKYNLL